jgi:hypothetical protein
MAKIFALHAEDKGSIPLNSNNVFVMFFFKGLAELADASDLGSDEEIRKGSTPLAFIYFLYILFINVREFNLNEGNRLLFFIIIQLLACMFG